MRAALILAIASLCACGRDALNLDGGTGSGQSTGGGAAGGGGGAGGGIASGGGGSGGGGMTGGGRGMTGGGGGGSPCTGLSAGACRTRSDCSPDFCFECTCTPQFKGCRRVGAPPFNCPLLGCASPECCTARSQCQGIDDCAPPGTPLGCGTCNRQPSTCSNDTQCGATEICEPRHCGCSGETDCVPGCGTNNPCPTGSTCTNKRCVAASCSTAVPCPTTFECLAGQCARRTCVSDFGCGDGFCVSGLCQDGWGECRGPVP